VFDLMRVKSGITEHEAVIVAARNTRAPDGRSVDEYNKSLVKNKSTAAILSVPLIIPFETYQPFDNDLLPVDTIPYEALPEQMANFIKEQSEIRGCPPDFILISILSRMGVLFAGKLAIALTRRTTWHAIPNFFWLMIGSPSSGKSNALSATEKPIKMLADIARATFKQQNKAYKAEMNMLTRQLNSALKGLDRENEKLAPDQDKVIGFRKRRAARSYHRID
jgi:hypothetical protein